MHDKYSYKHLTLKVWRLRVGEITTDDYIRCGLNQPQKNAALAIRNHCLVSKPPDTPPPPNHRPKITHKTKKSNGLNSNILKTVP